MAEVNLTINGRSFGISCDDGQEERVRALGEYINARIREIAMAGAAHNEIHLLMLAAITLADEAFDLREQVNVLGGEITETSALLKEELAIAEAIENLAGRIESIAGRVQNA